ncbi:292aed90-b939-4f33-9189-9e4aacd86745 [Thermothielavioides terrestris]|uniref:292aed90-b939-4f33-9189-9e4aacd86745 n=1 Tax=Thermothielavioides terrestris TaxID=2587410 RepID=A0A446BKN0_9PEZI|nr:292aed90-b939-4f33-9189-9e4aacd86745 [Thermothielavioides terrestris]
MSFPGDCAGAACTPFTNKCRAIILGLGLPVPGLVDAYGVPMRDLTNNTWGVNYTTCETHCGFAAIPVTDIFNFATFSAALTSYFLPWLALCAQLPFENAGPGDIFIGLCLAVGSPALITYSLALTLFNRSWAVKQVQRLLDRSVRRRQHLPAALAHTAAEFEQFEVRLQSFLSLAVEGQQVPLRASVVRHWLSSLIVSPANTAWWATVRERVRLSRRRPTLSLHAQISLAGIVWVFTIFTGVSAAVGAINTAIEIATSTLWVWLIPVTWGWIWVGTQYDKGSITIEDALHAAEAHRAQLPPDYPDSQTETGPQEAIFVESGLTREPAAAVTQHGQLHPASNHLLEPPKTLGMDTRGDEAKEGPVYTYARVFTWWAFTRRILDAFETTLDKMVENRQCREMPNPVAIEQQQPPPANPPQPNNNNNNNKPPPTPPRMLVGSAWQMSKYCNLPTTRQGFPQAGDPAPVRAYSRLRDVETAVWARMRDALAVALFAQWGTTGAAVVIAYNTPMVGWGCRSGSYLLYGLLGTAALACLLRSALLSHLAMRMYQQAYVAGGGGRRRTTRLVGKFIAVANAVILVLIGVFEFVGLFDNCWCKACYLQYGDSGYAVLFRSDADYRKLAQGAWVGGIIMATVVSIMLCCLFYFPSRSKLR